MAPTSFALAVFGLLSVAHCNVAARVAQAENTESGVSRIVQVWPGDPPAWPEATSSEQDLTDANSNLVAGQPIIRLTNVTDVQLHVFEARDASGNLSPTTMIVSPGGGYNVLAWDLEGTEIASQLQAGGVTAAVLKYRVPSRSLGDEKWKPAVQDIQRSVALVRAGKVTNAVPQHVGVLGFSAGGNATARTATSKLCHYEAVDSSDQSIRRPDFACLIYPAWLTEKELPNQLIPEIEVDKDTPPMFFAHSEDDPHTVLNSVTLFRQLHANGIPSSLHVFSGSGHGFGARTDGRADDLWPELCIRWIRDNGWIPPIDRIADQPNRE